MSETDISREIQAFLKEDPYVKHVRTNSSGFKSGIKGAPAGTADIIC